MHERELLRHIGLFENLSEDNIAEIVEICLTKKLRKKEILFFEEDKGYSLYILTSGSIQLFKSAPDGREVVIKVLKPGEMFAEVILFEQSTYPVSAIALHDSEVLAIPKHQFLCLLERENFRNEFIGSLLHKMRYLADQIRALTSYDVEDKFWIFIEDHFGRKTEILPKLTKKAIAAAIDTTPETLSRLLLRLKDDGKLVWEGKILNINPAVWQQR